MFYRFPAPHLRLFPDHIHKYGKGNLMLLSVHFKNILYVESEAELLRPEEELYWLIFLNYCDCDFAPFGLLIALIKVELFIWDVVDIFSKSWNHIEHQKDEESLLPHFTFFSCFLSVWITLCNSATVGCYVCGLISNTLTLPLVNE